MDTPGNVFERLPAREGPPSALFENSKNLASSFDKLRPDMSGSTMVPEKEMRREPQNSSIPVPRFRSGGGILNHTGGIFSHCGMIDHTRFPISEMHLGKFPDWNFKAGKSSSRLKYVRNQQILISQCIGSKKLRQQDELTNLRSYWRKRFRCCWKRNKRDILPESSVKRLHRVGSVVPPMSSHEGFKFTEASATGQTGDAIISGMQNTRLKVQSCLQYRITRSSNMVADVSSSSPQ